MGKGKEYESLNPGQSLHEDDWLISPGRQFEFRIVGGKPTIRHVQSKEPVWEKGLDGAKVDKIDFGEIGIGRIDHKLVFNDHNGDGKEIWNAGADHQKNRGDGWDEKWHNWEQRNISKWYDWEGDGQPESSQMVLTDNGKLLILKNKLDQDWGDLGPEDKNVLWQSGRSGKDAEGNPLDNSPERIAELKSKWDKKRDPEVGDKASEFLLRIDPPAKASENLKNFIAVCNDGLAYLMRQMGTMEKVVYKGKDKFGGLKPISGGKPLNLLSKGEDENPWNDFLEKKFLTDMSMGRGATDESHAAAAGRLKKLAKGWHDMDFEFKQVTSKLNEDNIRTYKLMYNKIQDAREAVRASLVEKDKGRLEPGYKSKFDQFGIQNLIEEMPLYPLLGKTVRECATLVANYAKQSEELAEYGLKLSDYGFPGLKDGKDGKGGKDDTGEKGDKSDKGGKDDTGEKGDKSDKGGKDDTGEKGDKSDKEKPAAKTTPPPTTITPPPYTPPPTQTTPTPQDMFPSPDSNPTLDDLGLGTMDSTDSPTGTPPIADSTSGDTPLGTDLRSLIRTATQDAGTGSTVAPSAPQQPTNSSGDAMGQIGQMMAMNALNQNRVPGDDRGYEDRESREDRQRERERNRAAQTATPNPAAQTAPPGVVAPAYVGSPPPVTTPGAMVDVQIGENTVKASQPVAEALQKQVQNTAIDAMSAYRGTAGELSADHPPAVINSRDPQAFNTGDIIQWERHNALIVKESNQLFVLDNGQLIPFDPGKPPLEEKYGLCTGYAHPTGLDGAAGGDPALATAAPPTVAAPKQPAGPPPVGPPQI